MHVCPRTSPNRKICEFWTLCVFCTPIAPDLRDLLQPRVHDVRCSGILCSKSGRTFSNCERVKNVIEFAILENMALALRNWPTFASRVQICVSPRVSRAKQLRHWPTFASRVQIGVSLRVSHAKQLRTWLLSRLVCKSVSPFVSLVCGGWVGSR